ncbi:hypothetical protein ACFE04_028841 [Oxalis oulophora]
MAYSSIETLLISKITSLEPHYGMQIAAFILAQGFTESTLTTLLYGPETHFHSVVIRVKSHLGFSSNTFSSPLKPIAVPISVNKQTLSPTPINKNVNFNTNSSPFLSYDKIQSGSPLLVTSNTHDQGDDFQSNGCFSFLDDSENNESGDFDGFSVDKNEGRPFMHMSENNGGGGGYRPCHYFAKGFCRNGDSCKFDHQHGGGVFGGGYGGGSSTNMSSPYMHHEEVLRNRLRVTLEQRWATELMAAGNGVSESHCRPDMMAMGLAQRMDSVGKQIYLTFPAESSFTDEDVANYFSSLLVISNVKFLASLNLLLLSSFILVEVLMDKFSVISSRYGPVQDVRIPYQQQRMFGFVTFVYSESAKFILSIRNPHYICSSRVLVKAYKDKGKLSDKMQRQRQQLENGNYLSCSSLAGFRCMDSYESQLGARAMCNTPELMYNGSLQEDVMELQNRMFMKLQLQNDINYHPNLGVYICSPTFSPNHIAINQNAVLPPNVFDKYITQDLSVTTIPPMAAEQQSKLEATAVYAENGNNNNNKDLISEAEGFGHHEHPEDYIHHNLPDSLFAGDLASALAWESASFSEDNKPLA